MAIATAEIVARAEAFAERLLGGAFARTSGAARDSVDLDAFESWLGPPSPGVATTGVGATLFMGCARALIEMSRRLGPTPRPRITGAADYAALHPREASLSHAAWSGYVPVGGGWLSIAMGTAEERERVARCLAVLGIDPPHLNTLGTIDIAPVDLAGTLQEWGIASFPATSAAAEPLPPANTLVPLWALMRKAGLVPARPLANVRVLDCGQLVSGPWAGALLSFLGAEVVAVAHPVRRASRRYGPEPIELDLRTSADRRAFAALCRATDVVIDNFRPRVWGNLGLDPVELGALRHLSLPSFGIGSGQRNLRSYGFQLEALYGVGHAPTGTRRAPITASSRALLDHSAGFAGAVAAVAAITEGRKGRMELSHVSLLEQLREGDALAQDLVDEMVAQSRLVDRVRELAGS